MDNVPEALGTPPSFVAPELAFGYQPSYAVDLWALGCLIFELHTYRVLIPTIFGSVDESIAMATETIGALPEAWLHSFYDKEESFIPESPDEKHYWFNEKVERTRTLESHIRKDLPDFSQDQRTALLRVLNSLLVWEPNSRLPAAEVATDPWFESE